MNQLNQSEALYSFMGWLTTRDKPVIFSRYNNAAIAAELTDLFCKVQNLPGVTDQFVKKGVSMSGKEPDPDYNVIAEAMIVIVKALKEDTGYYEGWKANIAMAFQDEFNKEGRQFEGVHKIANQAAENFLQTLIR